MTQTFNRTKFQFSFFFPLKETLCMVCSIICYSSFSFTQVSHSIYTTWYLLTNPLSRGFTNCITQCAGQPQVDAGYFCLCNPLNTGHRIFAYLIFSMHIHTKGINLKALAGLHISWPREQELKIPTLHSPGIAETQASEFRILRNQELYLFWSPRLSKKWRKTDESMIIWQWEWQRWVNESLYKDEESTMTNKYYNTTDTHTARQQLRWANCTYAIISILPISTASPLYLHWGS